MKRHLLLLATLIAAASGTVLAMHAPAAESCNPMDDPGCFEVVICHNTLGCAGGIMQCAEMTVGGEQRYCTKAVE
jgi:hypothetical protein